MLFKHLLTTAAVLFPLWASAENTPKVVDLVQVNGTTINNLDLAIFSAQATRDPQKVTPENQAIILEELVNIFMLANSKEGKELVQHREIAAALKVARARLIAEALVRKQMQDAQVSEQAIQKIYQSEHVNKPGTEYQARHILLNTEAEANAVIQALNQGADFAELARQKSEGPSKTVGGDLGWFSSRQMVKPFTEAVAGMQKGTYSSQPVKTKYGWHVILLNDSRPIPTPSLEEIRPSIVQYLKSKKVAKYIEKISKKSKVEILAKK